MAAEQLQIQVSANVSNAVNGLNDLEKSLKSTETAGVKLGSQGLPQVAKGASQANTAMINLGRTVSDAPFGFIGIANNIGPLVENFTQLRKESGSTGGALKQLGASLAGPGGVILGIQLAVAAIQFIELGLSRWGVKSKEAKQKQDELSGSIAQQYTQVLLLTSAYERDKSLEGRKEILSQLNTVSSEYFGNLKAEQTSIEDLKKSYDGYIQNLLQSFAVKQLEADLEPLVKQLAVAQSTVRKIGPDLQKLGLVKDITGLTGAELEKTIKYNQQLQDGFTKLNDQQRKALSTSGVFKYNQAVNESNKLWNQINELINNASVLYSNSTKQTKTGKSKEKSLQEQINELLKKYLKDIEGINWDEQNRGLDGTNDRLDTALDALKEITLKGVNPTAASFRFLTAEVEKFRSALDYKNFKDNLEKINSEVKAQGAVRAQLDNELKFSLTNATNLINQQIKSEKALNDFRLKEFEKQIELQKQLQSTIEGGLTNALTSVFDALIDGENVFEALSKSVRQLVSDLIRVVIQMTVVKAITNALFPNAGASADALFTFKMRSDVILKSLGRAY